MTVDELRKRLIEVTDLDAQKVILETFIESTTHRDILEGIRISNNIPPVHQLDFRITSLVKE